MNLDNINSLLSKATDLRGTLASALQSGVDHPQNDSGNRGFLPPHLIAPVRDYGTELDTNGDGLVDNSKPGVKKQGSYQYVDWMGQLIEPSGFISNTEDRFKESRTIKEKNIKDSPLSMRDHLLIFNDQSTDYFKHGLQVIDGLASLENTLDSTNRLSAFTKTPSESDDPVIFGIEIIIDDVTSPLLNGSISDFLVNYRNVSEINARIPLYEDFKQQIIKLFKTKSTVKIDTDLPTMSNVDNLINNDSQSDIFRNGRSAYKSYYIKKVGGLDKLIESNTSTETKSITDYRKDLVNIEFYEDVSATIGTLAHLYKQLYWSKPNSKGIVPENLLRFNCQIIISECRNFNRVIKASKNGDLQVIKDNMTRYVYSLEECQFFFSGMPHPDSINMWAIDTYDGYNINFNYKYSSMRFERFQPTLNFGSYVGYDNGAIWKIANSRGRSTGESFSRPPFQSTGSVLNENGIKEPFILKKYNSNDVEDEEVLNDENVKDKSGIIEKQKKGLKERTKDAAKRLKDNTIKSAKKELATFVNARVNLLSRSINKILNAVGGGQGISPPKNIYLQPYNPGSLGYGLSNINQRFFYDIRGEIEKFGGDSIAGALNGVGLNSKYNNPKRQ